MKIVIRSGVKPGSQSLSLWSYYPRLLLWSLSYDESRIWGTAGDRALVFRFTVGCSTTELAVTRLVDPVGIEPTTPSLQGWCSTN